MTIGIVTFVVLIAQSKVSARERPKDVKEKQVVLTIVK
jgi:hypothetical protein